MVSRSKTVGILEPITDKKLIEDAFWGGICDAETSRLDLICGGGQVRHPEDY